MCNVESVHRKEVAAVIGENEEKEEHVQDSVIEENVSYDFSTEENSSNSNARRTRETPVWMRDYERGEGLSEEDYVAHLVMFAVADPIHFDDAGGKMVGVKWSYKTKFNEKGEMVIYKARLVVKGYVQQHGIECTKLFESVPRMDRIFW